MVDAVALRLKQLFYRHNPGAQDPVETRSILRAGECCFRENSGGRNRRPDWYPDTAE
jgi:hypothetical protein